MLIILLPIKPTTLSLHDALPIFTRLTARRNSLSARLRDEVFERRSILRGAAAASPAGAPCAATAFVAPTGALERSEEHTSELQSPYGFVFRLLLEKKPAATDYAL